MSNHEIIVHSLAVLWRSWPLPGAWPILALAVGLASASGGVAAQALPGGFSGTTYGALTSGVAGPLAAALHKPAYRPLPCGGTNGALVRNSLSNYTAGRVLRAATIIDSIVTSSTSIQAEMHSTSTLTDVSLFDGLITAATLQSVANTVADAGLITGDDAGSLLTGLQIAGSPVPADLAANTVLELPGIGSVTVRSKRNLGGNASSRRTLVDALLVTVTSANKFGLPVGSTLEVGHAESGFNRRTGQQSLGGNVWLASATGELQESPGFQAISCAGTGGKTQTRQITNFRLATVEIATATTTIAAAQTAVSAQAHTSATLGAGSLLGGRISFDAIAVAADDQFNGSLHVRTATGPTFTGLRIDGVPVTGRITPKRRIELPGLGYVLLNERSIPTAAAAGKITVFGLHVYITTANALGLAAGSSIIVAAAEATTQRRPVAP